MYDSFHLGLAPAMAYLPISWRPIFHLDGHHNMYPYTSQSATMPSEDARHYWQGTRKYWYARSYAHTNSETPVAEAVSPFVNSSRRCSTKLGLSYLLNSCPMTLSLSLWWGWKILTMVPGGLEERVAVLAKPSKNCVWLICYIIKGL